MSAGSKATSVTAEGTDDGFEIQLGYRGEIDARGGTRLVVSVPTARLGEVHQALIGALEEPLGLLYRRKVDRAAGKELNPPKDFVALDLPKAGLQAVLEEAALLVWHDARAEWWIRGRLGDQVVLDTDGLLYAYPDDPAFRDALAAVGVPIAKVPTMSERDYVKHWFAAGADALEEALLQGLGAAEVPHRR